MAKARAIPVLQPGGRNGSLASNLSDNEFPLLTNFLKRPNGRLATRPGYAAVSTVAYPERLLTLFPRKTTSGVWTLLAGVETGLATFNSGTGAFTAVTLAGGIAIPSSTERWVIYQYKDITYQVRQGSDVLLRFDGSTLGESGMAAPATAPTLADGGATGSLDPGTYKGVYTYKNTRTGQESNPSPTSNALTIAANHEIDWSGITVPPVGSQADAIVLYRTTPDQVEEFYKVVEIAITSTTYADDDVSIDELVAAASYRNGLPPEDPIWGTIFNEHNFITDGTDLFFSEPGSAEGFSATSIIQVFPDDGHKITGLHVFGSRLIVPKTNAVHYLLGTDRSSFALRTLDDKNPCPCPFSMQSGSGNLFWFTGRKVVVSQGGGAVDISSPWVEDLLTRVNPAAYSKVTGTINTAYSIYALDVPLDSATENTHRLVYNWQTREWQLWQYTDSDAQTVAPASSAFLFDAYGSELMYGVFESENIVHNLLSGNSDDGVNITATVRSKAFSSAEPGKVLGVHRVAAIVYPKIASTLTARLYLDLQTTAYKSRSVSINSDGWKNLSLSSMQKLASFVQLELEYTGTAGIEIGGFLKTVEDFKRYARML